MTNQDILSHIDHTLLKATATWADIAALCDEAVAHGVASVCVPPCYVERIHQAYGGKVNICTVVGFPLGYSCTEAKAAEVRRAVADGAGEVDMVINLTDVKNGRFDAVTREISTLKEASQGRILKVIIETCYLTREEKIALCRCVTQGGADYIKTSTGFGTAGATLEDVLLFAEHIGPGVKIKAAGGVRTREDLVAFLEAGADRIGTSSAVKLLEGEAAEGY